MGKGIKTLALVGSAVALTAVSGNAAVLADGQVGELTSAMTAGSQEYFGTLFSIAVVTIPIALIAGLLWKFVPKIGGGSMR